MDVANRDLAWNCCFFIITSPGQCNKYGIVIQRQHNDDNECWYPIKDWLLSSEYTFVKHDLQLTSIDSITKNEPAAK